MNRTAESDIEIAWVVLRRCDDPIEAQMLVDYLRGQGHRVALQGNSGATSILNRFDTVLDIRIVVPDDEAEDARETLLALDAPPPSDREAPYRGSLPPETSGARVRALAGEDDDATPRRRYKRAAFALAFALPFGGGHFYAQHGAAGAMFAAGIVAGFLGSIVSQRQEPIVAAILLVVIDMLTSPRAVARYNAGRVPTAGAQRAWSLLAIVAAYGLAALVVPLLTGG